jgi:hypothetical protein
MSRYFEGGGNFARVNELKSKLNGGVDEYTRVLALQNEGIECPHCDCRSGHKLSCGLINRDAAEQRSREITEPNHIASL